MRRASKPCGGFSLLEMVVVISITGIIGAMVAVFMVRPVQSYTDSVQRAEFSDIADTALRRIVRDLKLALPNSVRVTQSPPGTFYLEMLLTSGGGRYRVDQTGAGAGDPLDFTTADGSFDVIGPALTFAGGESIVVYNLGFTGADAYAGDNRTPYGGAVGGPVSNIVLNPAKKFPLASPGNRFHVVQHAVTYKCDPAAREMRRYWNYTIAAPQPTTPSGGSNAQLARNVGACTITYDPNAIQGRNGIVSLSLTLSTGPGSPVVINLFAQTHVSNVP